MAIAKFPSNVWTGTSPSRSDPTDERSPNNKDWDQLIVEIQAIENFLKAIFNVSPNAAAIFEVDSTTQGILLPRMTTTQRGNISSPPEGLIIWNTSTHTLNVFNGTTWQAVTAS